MVVERINMSEGEMSGATVIIKGTLPELHKTERNVPTKGMCDIFEPEDVLAKYEESCDNPGVMGTCLQPMDAGGSTNHPGHDILRDQLLTYCEESWQQGTEVLATTILRSMALKKG